LNADGTRDGEFLAGSTFNSDVLTVAVQLDGKLVVGGYFSAIGGVARKSIARLNADGTLDATFDVGTGANNLVYAALIDAGQRVVIGGAFTQINGVARNRVVRLYGDLQPVFFATQPQSVTVAAGSPATFSVSLVSVAGTSQPEFQWRFNGVNLPGKTAATLTIPAAFVANEGGYDVVVSNAIGSAVSRAATLTIAKAVPAVTWPAPANITYGTALSSAQHNAATPVAGTFTYQPPTGTRLNAGAGQVLTVVFTPADLVNYASVTNTRTITVLRAALTVMTRPSSTARRCPPSRRLTPAL
jgi:hypothetical protein